MMSWTPSKIGNLPSYGDLGEQIFPEVRVAKITVSTAKIEPISSGMLRPRSVQARYGRRAAFDMWRRAEIDGKRALSGEPPEPSRALPKDYRPK